MERLKKYLTDKKIKYEFGKLGNTSYITIFSFINNDFIRIYKDNCSNISDFYYCAYSYLVNIFIPNFVYGKFL